MSTSSIEPSSSGVSSGLRAALPLIAFALAVVAFVVLYVGDVVPEDVAGLAFAGLVVVAACAYLVRALLPYTDGGAERAVLMALAVLVGAAALSPAVLTIAPGTPLEHVEVSKRGDRVELPAETNGWLRLLVHGRLLSDDPSARVDLGLRDGDRQLAARLQRTSAIARVGRRGHTRVHHDHSAEYLEVPPQQSRGPLEVTRLDGALQGPLEIDIFSDPLPPQRSWPLEIGVLLVLALAAGATPVAANAIGTAAFALTFGLMVQRMVTPGQILRSEIGALIVAVLGAVIASLLVTPLVRRVLRAA